LDILTEEINFAESPANFSNPALHCVRSTTMIFRFQPACRFWVFAILCVTRKNANLGIFFAVTNY
jgi:hypothetical protein